MIKKMKRDVAFAIVPYSANLDLEYVFILLSRFTGTKVLLTLTRARNTPYEKSYVDEFSHLISNAVV